MSYSCDVQAARNRRDLEPIQRRYSAAVVGLVETLEDDLQALATDAGEDTESVDAARYVALVRDEYGIEDDCADAVQAQLEAMVAGGGRPNVEHLNPIGAFTDAIRVMLRFRVPVGLDLEKRLADDPAQAERLVVEATYDLLADSGKELDNV